VAQASGEGGEDSRESTVASLECHGVGDEHGPLAGSEDGATRDHGVDVARQAAPADQGPMVRAPMTNFDEGLGVVGARVIVNLADLQVGLGSDGFWGQKECFAPSGGA